MAMAWQRVDDPGKRSTPPISESFRLIADSSGAGHADAAQRPCEALHFAGDAIMTDTEAFCAALGKTGKT